MKKALLLIGIVSAFLFLAACKGENLKPTVTALEGENATLKQQVKELQQRNKTLRDVAGPLPTSLDNFYHPKAPAPVWLLEMFALSAPMEGIMVDLQENDTAGVKGNYDAFKAQYSKMAGMVPEWKELFPSGPVDALGQAIASGDPAKIGPAMGAVGQVCGTCHLVNMTKAQAKYHWPDFAAIKVTDPITNEQVPWAEYMMRMGVAWSGAGNDMKQGQMDNARRNFQAFSARFKVLPERGCSICHATPRTYFVDQSIMALLDQLGKEVASAAPNPQKIEELSGAIGNESCMKCHLVHLPATHTKARWENLADLFK